jgi:hypothetical protein
MDKKQPSIGLRLEELGGVGKVGRVAGHSREMYCGIAGGDSATDKLGVFNFVPHSEQNLADEGLAPPHWQQYIVFPESTMSAYFRCYRKGIGTPVNGLAHDCWRL